MDIFALVMQGKDYEITTLTELEIGVENEEPLFFCVDGKPASSNPKMLESNNKVKVAVKVIDVNDPPVFQNKIHMVYKVEEEDPGDVLYTPTVTDEDSDPTNIRYEEKIWQFSANCDKSFEDFYTAVWSY